MNDWLRLTIRIGNVLQYNLAAAMSNSTLKKHLPVSVFVALWILFKLPLPIREHVAPRGRRSR
jgi:hypothetical protein